MTDQDDCKWCDRCLEDFPVAPAGSRIDLGKLYPLSRFSGGGAGNLAVQRACKGDHSSYVCGNCYFDLTDTETGALFP